MYEKARFEKLCPNCEGEITDVRLSIKNPCDLCIPEPVREDDFDRVVYEVYTRLEKENKLGKYRTIYDVVSRLNDFNEFFHRITKSYLWSAQRTWAKRFFLGRSFSIVAPTGIGKTSFGIALALYLATEGEKTYFILPTKTLLNMVDQRAREYAEKAGVKVRILSVQGSTSKKKRQEIEEKIRRGEFDILITTSQFLTRNFDLLKDMKIDFAFVDDVDAFLRASKNIDRVLQILGFSEEIINDAYELIRAKISLVFRSNDQKLRKRIEELQKKIEEYKKRHELGQLIVASATGRSRGLRVKLFRELLEFEIGSTRANLRNVINAYTEFDEERIIETVKEMGSGGIVFVPLDKGQEYAREIVEKLKSAGIRADFATSERATKVLDAFTNGEIDVAVGMAAYYGTLVRGIDLPERIKYTVFAGVPKFKFPLSLEGAPPGRLAFLSDILAGIVEDRSTELKQMANRLRRAYKNEELLENARRTLSEILERRDVLEELKKSREVAITEEEGSVKIMIADVRTYIQASGRTSRMYAGGITQGLSVVFVDETRVFDQLRRYMRYVLDEEFVPLEELDLKAVKRELEEDRKKIHSGRFEDPVKTVLFVVESPNKARTIANFFGQPSVYRIGNIRGYEVATGRYVLNIVATRGHMFDLVTERGFHGVEIRDNWFIPVYTTIKYCLRCGVQTVEDKCPVCGSDKYLDDAIWRVNALRLFALESDFVIIGTDPDREGEKIAWDTALAISPYVPKIARAEFHEVTRSAILRALEEIREIDENRVNAQIVRRVEDRWIGFELSRRLWVKFGNRTLSAGRVQTPVLGWVIQRYREHKESITVFLDVSAGKNRTIFETEFKSPKKAEEYAEGKKLTVKIGEKWEEEVSPPPPFTTDEMLREAGQRMRLGAREVMELAQDLFEAGLITYHRTDSTHVSPTGMAIAREYIREKYGEEYYSGRPWGEEGAHECIRPTKPIDTDTLIRLLREGDLNIQGITKRHLFLYSIIFERFIASQMRKARVEKARIVYELGRLKREEEGVINIIEPGWTLVRNLQTLQVREGEYEVSRVRAFKAAKVPLYTQSDLVALMKERGIGRPSTYATIIQKLLDRRYIMESRQKRRVYPTPLGISVYEYLSTKFPHLVSEDRTRELEETLDAIERGERSYQEAIRETYEEVKAVEGEL